MKNSIAYKLTYAHGLATCRRFDRACKRTEELQRRLLARMLREHRGTAFGRQFGFAGLRGDADAYRSAVPIQDYEAHRPWIDRIVQHGEQNVLFGRRQKLVMFNQTSGTTSAPKLIPVTSRWLSLYRRTSLLWGMLALRDHPEMFEGKILQVTGALQEGATDRGVPVGSASAMHAASQKRVVRGFYSTPQSVFHVQDYDSRYYSIARVALGQSISLLGTANPSTVLRLVRLIDERSEELIRDVRDGSVSEGVTLPPDVRADLSARLRPDPERAKELSRLRDAAGGSLRPRDYWPQLAFLATWQGGPLVSYLQEIPEWFDTGTPIRDVGLLASEARMTIPVSDGTPGGALDIESHFFEFLPVEEADAESPRTLLAHEVEVGKRYLILFTSWAGLYRYDIADVVEVQGFHGTTPIVAFLHKGRHMTSVTGEKISERQVVEAVRAANTSGAGVPSTFVAYPRMEPGEVPYYVLAFETGGGTDVAAAVDRALRELNVEYDAKRASGRLERMQVLPLPPGTFERVRQRRLSASGTPEQYKHVYLAPERPDYVQAELERAR